MGAVFTLSAIGALVLGVGMTVDVNIIILNVSVRNYSREDLSAMQQILVSSFLYLLSLMHSSQR